MVRRSLGAALWSVAGLLAVFLGMLGGLTGTAAGRALLAAAARSALDAALAGSVQIGAAGGPLLTGLWLRDVVIRDPDGGVIAAIDSMALAYTPIALGPRRIVLDEVYLVRPRVNLAQGADGRLNVERLLRPKPPSATRTVGRPLVLFRVVDVTDGELVLRLRDRPSPGDSLLEIEQDSAAGRRRVRRFTGLSARVNGLRLAAPGARGVRGDIARFAVVISDPPVDARELRGRFALAGDTLNLDLSRVRLPGTFAEVVGTISWPRDTVLYALDVAADPATLVDLRFIDPRFPAGAVMRGEARVDSRSERETVISLDPLDVRYRGGRVTGGVTAVSRAGEGLVALEGADLDATDLDLDLARPFLDTLPFAGRLTGHTVAVGALSALALEVDWTFRDKMVPDWPTTRLRGSGQVSLGDADGLRFREFTVAASDVDLATVRQLVPGFVLAGRLAAVGTLDGTPKDAVFVGDLRHQDGERPASVLHGRVGLDARGDPLVLDADVTAAPLALPGLRGTFPWLGLEARLEGAVRARGPIDSLALDADVHSPDGGGAVRAVGTVGLYRGRRAARGLEVTVTDLDLARWLPDGAASRLTGRAWFDLVADSGAPLAGTARADLAPSLLVGMPLDTGTARLRFADGRVIVDTLGVDQTGVRVTAQGTLGIDRPALDGLDVVVVADSLERVDSLAIWLADRAGMPRDTGVVLHGAGRAALTIRGRVDSFTVDGAVESHGVHWRRWYAGPGRSGVTLTRASAAQVLIEGSLDSLAIGEMGFGAPRWRLSGRVDSLSWFARSRVGELGAFLGGGTLERGGRGTAVAVDSLAVLVPGAVWFLTAPTVVALGDSGADVGQIEFRNTADSGVVRASGVVPLAGAASAHIEVAGFPLAGVYALLQRDTVGIGGVISVDATIAGTRAAPAMEGRFALHDPGFGAVRAPGLAGTFTYRDQRLDVAGQIERDGARLIDFTAALPLDLAFQPVARRRLPGPVSGRARADSVSLSALEAITRRVRQTRGRLDGDVRLQGTWETPVLAGAVAIRDAALTIPALSVRYEGVAGHFSLGGDTIRVDSLVARSGQGRARITGSVRMVDLTRPVLDLDITADRFRALDLRNRLSLTASGRLTLNGRVYGATLSGRGTVNEGVWYFRDVVTKRVVNLDDPGVRTLIDTTWLSQDRLREEFQSRFLDSLRIRDLELTMGSSVWLRSAETNVQLEGALALDKERDQYRMRGTLRAPRGTYRLIVGPVTREFVVTEGTVRYFGTPDLDAALDIEARHVVRPVPVPGREAEEEITVIAHIGGTLLAPRLTLRTEERELPQAEIISYLMFGLPSVAVATAQGEGGDTQRYLLQNAVSSLVTGELARALVSDLGVPLDYVEIRPGSPSDPLSGSLFAAGWAIGPKTFLIVNAGFCQGRPISVQNTLGGSLQYRFNTEWRAEASFEPLRTCTLVDQNATVVRQLGLDLLWEKRF